MGDRNAPQQRLHLLGIPLAEMTPAVSLAVTALLERIDDVTMELENTRAALAEMDRLVDADCLAPIPNRRAFMRRLGWAIAMHQRYGHPSTILYFDLNDFKAINDEYGHAAGDAAIRHVSQLLSSTMRESDFIARIGGDEFGIIMYYASEQSARRRGAKITDLIRRTPFMFDGRGLYISASLGCHALRAGDDAESALAAADREMYANKRGSKAGAA